ncbi:hypothetical protein COY95_03880, partial [Candidatus Woesearchaeota archaeon CG_4_10_14_0_8_um_filter_47_5]
MSLNIYWGLGGPSNPLDYLGRLALYPKTPARYVKKIAAFIKEIDPDVACFQEIDNGSQRTLGFSQIRYLATNTPLTHAFFAPEKTRFTNEGNAILARKPFSAAMHTLPYLAERRNCIAADFGAFIVLTTHLASHWLGWYERTHQLKKLAHHIRLQKKPVILLGDFNRTIPSWFLEKNGLTVAILEPTFPNFFPVFRYDTILCSPTLTISQAKALKVHLSDHLPILVNNPQSKIGGISG